MGPFIKKDFLLLWRDRNETYVSLLMAFVLILVLGTVLSSWVEKPNEPLAMTVAIVNQDDEEPRALLQMLSETKFVTTVKLDNETASRRLQDKEVEAIITIPAGFSQASQIKTLPDQGKGAALSLTADRHASLRVDVLQDLLNEYAQSVNLQTAVIHAQDVRTVSLNQTTALPKAFGGREKIDGVKMLTAYQYFTVAISIVIVMFMASTTALKAITEKREQVLQRILLSGSHPIRYLTGKAVSTVCLSFLQLMLLIVANHFIFGLFPGRSTLFWLGMTEIVFMFCLSIGALSAVFTSLTFHMKNSAANGLFTLFLGIAGTIGGSFLPIYLLPDWLKHVGEWTPNGVSLAVFIQWIGQDSTAVLTAPFLKLAVFSIAVSVLALLIFPRRGRI